MDIIRENFFHFLWKNIHFGHTDLKTTMDAGIRIIHPGHQNSGDGPDYRFACIRMGGLRFHGDVELHKKASEWYRHGHHRDERYNRVILHVVIHSDLNGSDVHTAGGAPVPTLELRTSLPPSLSRLWRAFHRPVALPCSGLVQIIPDSRFRKITDGWDRRYFRHRQDRLLDLYPADKPMTRAWTEMLIRAVFQGLGYHKNQDNMLRLADFILEWIPQFHNTADLTAWLCRTPDLALPAKPDHPQSGENNLFAGSGQSKQPPHEQHPGRSDSDRNHAVQTLSRLLLHKAGLAHGDNSQREQSILKRQEWDFSATRPANQPQNRIRQGAELYCRIQTVKMQKWLTESPDALWNELCRLEHAPAIGKNRRDVLLHNVVLPAVHLLSRWLDHPKQVRAVDSLWESQRIPLPSHPRKIFIESGFPPGKHYYKLATLHHFKYTCSQKRCDECEVLKYLAQA
ncbi:DUF2851 family protein [Balneolales bacterium ANBcel1]|nr:DUF2851 family protein [Balneolales bacterium ANBcel1]